MVREVLLQAGHTPGLRQEVWDEALDGGRRLEAQHPDLPLLMTYCHSMAAMVDATGGAAP